MHNLVGEKLKFEFEWLKIEKIFKNHLKNYVAAILYKIILVLTTKILFGYCSSNLVLMATEVTVELQWEI